MDTDELPAIYELESIGQMRAVADELRLRILDQLTRRAMTVTQLGDALGVAPAKAHYHVRELERVRLVRLVETRERGGILEKYYRAVAQDIRVSKSLIQAAPADETLAIFSDHLQSITRGFMRAFARDLAAPGGPTGFTQFSAALVWMTDEEMRDVARRVMELLAPYRDPRPDVVATPHMVVQLGYGVVEDDAVTGHALPTNPDEAAQTANQPISATLRRHRVFHAGGVIYARADLERVVAAGEALDITAVGALAFADDVPSQLADRAVARLRVRGSLSAAPAVRAVLERKQQRPQPREEA